MYSMNVYKLLIYTSYDSILKAQVNINKLLKLY